MPAMSSETRIGGEQKDFRTTHWSEIFSARTTDDERREIVMDSLLRRYWKPVYCCIRRQGYDRERAKDLTQGFFQEVVLGSSLVAQADRAKGRFRGFLLTALNHYLIGVHRKKKARKRTPPGRMLALESNDLPDLPVTRSSMSPEQLFNYVWATEIIDQVLVRVEQECRSTGKEQYWQVFRARVLGPIMENASVPSLPVLCRKYGVGSAEKASNMIITVKRCFRRTLEDHLRRFVRTDSEIEDELGELLGILGRGGAG